jgi:hypothetical protein
MSFEFCDLSKEYIASFAVVVVFNCPGSKHSFKQGTDFLAKLYKRSNQVLANLLLKEVLLPREYLPDVRIIATSDEADLCRLN